MTELNREEMEKAVGGSANPNPEQDKPDIPGKPTRAVDNVTLMRKCKYELKWTKSQYLDWGRSQGANDAELARASALWDTI